MARYRRALPQLKNRLFLTDGGLETTLMFHDGMDLPHFAAFDLLRTPEGTNALRKYFLTYTRLAVRAGAGMILESPTWRANSDWGSLLGYTNADLSEANRKAIRLLEEIREEFDSEETPVVVSGCLGPRGDGYFPAQSMSAEDAERYHRTQMDTFAGTAADMVCALTMNYAEEAIGIVRAAREAGIPVAISFTVETDGNLPTGQTLEAAIEQVDDASSSYASYFMINCAHPTHFDKVLRTGRSGTDRIRGIRANASRMSHAELNEAGTLDTGDPNALGREYAELKKKSMQLTVLGGCCGTDHRHVERIAESCGPLFHRSV